MTIRIGISGWRYAPWRGEFYPPGLVQRRELEYAAGCFPTIEINGSFYSLQSPDSYTAWHDATPDDFVFAVKGPRYITHLKRLRDVERPLANFLASGVLRLGGKLGPMLWQLPPTLKFDEALIDAFLSALPRDTDAALSLARRRDVALMRGRSALAIDRNRPLRHALEVRHDSFLDRRFVQLLRRHRTALVVADTAGRWPYLEDVTADFLTCACMATPSCTSAGTPTTRCRDGRGGSGTGRAAAKRLTPSGSAAPRRSGHGATSFATSTTT